MTVCIQVVILLEKNTHMWRLWGKTQNFCLAFTDESEKQLLKKLLKWTNKKCKNFNIYNVPFFKRNNKEKPLEISLFYTCVP